MERRTKIATSVEDYDRLKNILSPDTADMSISTSSLDVEGGVKYSLIPFSQCKNHKIYGIIPSWSLSKLRYLLPGEIKFNGITYTLNVSDSAVKVYSIGYYSLSDYCLAQSTSISYVDACVEILVELKRLLPS